MLTRTILTTVIVSLILASAHRAVGDVTRPTPHELAAIAAAEGERLWFHEEEFRRNPALRAAPHQIVILHLARAPKHQRFIDHVIPYIFLETSTYTFCIPKKEPFLQELTLIREGDTTPVVQVKQGHKCQTREIVAGFYRLQVRHDGKTIGPDGKKAFIHVPRFKGIVLTKNSQGPQATSALLSTSTASSLPACDSTNSLNNAYLMLTVANGQYISDGSYGAKVSTQSTPPDALGGWYICPDGSGNYTIFQTGGPTTFTASGPPSTDTSLYVNYPATPFKLTDLGNDQFTLAANFGGTLYPVVLGSDNVLHWAAQGTPPAVFTIALKYYPLTGVAQPLLPGEAALFQACNYDVSSTGTWVFTTTFPNLGAFRAFGVTLDNTVASIKLGPQTITTLYANTNFGGIAQVVGKDIPCLNSTPLGVNTASSVQVTPARQFVASTDECQNCNLSGVDLSNLDLSGGQFPGSTFTGATLAYSSLQGATLDNANLDGADTILFGANFVSALLHCTNFSGADLSQATVLLSSIKPIVTTDFSCRVDLTGAIFNLSSFPLTQWRYFNLTGATINGVTGATLSTSANPLDLSGAILNQTLLSQVHLDGANLGCASAASGPECTQLIETTLTSASLKKATLVDALLQGAHLDFANLDGANLCAAKLNESPTSQLSATLQGAFLRNINLSQADLTGAFLANVNFYSTSTPTSCAPSACGFTASCASAVNAKLNNTVFSGAYLDGVDFSGSTPQSVDFSNAWLAGSHFTNANLSQDPSTGKRTDFTQALLQGTTFTNATVTGANFTSATVDLTHSTGQTLLAQLNPATHIAFPGYTPWVGSTLGCVEFVTKQNTGLPGTNNSNLCPDGAGGPCSTTQWQSPKVPSPPLPTNCTFSTTDLNWIIVN